MVRSEHIKQARQRATPVVPLEGARTVRINFVGRRFEVALLRRLGWWDLVYAGSLNFLFSFCVCVVGHSGGP